jgi:predicted ATPase
MLYGGIPKPGTYYYLNINANGSTPKDKPIIAYVAEFVRRDGYNMDAALYHIKQACSDYCKVAQDTNQVLEYSHLYEYDGPMGVHYLLSILFRNR